MSIWHSAVVGKRGEGANDVMCRCAVIVGGHVGCGGFHECSTYT